MHYFRITINHLNTSKNEGSVIRADNTHIPTNMMATLVFLLQKLFHIFGFVIFKHLLNAIKPKHIQSTNVTRKIIGPDHLHINSPKGHRSAIYANVYWGMQMTQKHKSINARCNVKIVVEL